MLRKTLYPTMFWELLASQVRFTLCAAAKAGSSRNKKSARRVIRLPTDFDCRVRFLTVPPLLPVLAHGRGIEELLRRDPDYMLPVKKTQCATAPLFGLRATCHRSRKAMCVRN